MGSRLFLQLSPVQSQAMTNTTKLATIVRSKPNNGRQAGKQAPEADGNQHRHHLSTNFSFALQDSGWASVVRFPDTMASLTCPSSTFSLHGHTDASFALAAAAALLHTTTASMTSPRLALSSSHTHNGPGHSPLFRKRKRRTAHGAPVGRLPSSSYRGISALALRLQTCSVTAPSEAVQDADEPASAHTNVSAA